MRTLIRLRNANCTDCLNAIHDDLLTRDLVLAVHVHAADGCIEVEHDHDEPDALVELLRGSLRGWQIADNGEIVQVAAVPELAHVCHVHTTNDTHAQSRPENDGQLGGESPCYAHILDDLDTGAGAVAPHTVPAQGNG